MNHGQRDYAQLLGYIKALETLESRIDALMTEKSRLLHEAQACHFNKRALKELMRLRGLGSCHDADVPTVYEALTSHNATDNMI